MVILGIEAAARCCSAAIYKDGSIVAGVHSNSGLTHSETLMPMIERVFSMSGITPEEVDYIALTNGPGSFTGLRIGAATAKGLSMGLNKPLVPLGTLEVAAYGIPIPGVIRVATMDARRHQVYAAAYQLMKVDGVVTDKAVIEPEAMSPEELLERLQGMEGTFLFLGDAADLYEDYFREHLAGRYEKAASHVKDLSAAACCTLAAKKLADGTATAIPSYELSITYLRKPQAEREREEREKREEREA